MKIAILSQNAHLYSTRRLREAGQKQGHDMRVIDYLRCYMNITSKKPSIVYKGKLLENFDAIIPRIGASKTFYGTAVVRQFEVMDVFSPNKSQATIGVAKSLLVGQHEPVADTKGSWQPLIDQGETIGRVLR